MSSHKGEVVRNNSPKVIFLYGPYVDVPIDRLINFARVSTDLNNGYIFNRASLS